MFGDLRLIVWDEASMVHKNFFEALDRTLRDIMDTYSLEAVDKPFGRKTILLEAIIGKFGQLLKVVKKKKRNYKCNNYSIFIVEVLQDFYLEK